MADRYRKAQRGFSLVELLVAFALLMVVVLVVSQLIVQSLHLLKKSGHTLRDPTVTMAAAWLRRDVQGSVEAAKRASGWTLPTVWSPEPLQLSAASGHLIVIGLDGTDLVRTLYEPASPDVAERRVLLPNVALWQCRLPIPGLVDCEIRLLNIDSSDIREGADYLDPIFIRARIERFRFALRRGGARW